MDNIDQELSEKVQGELLAMSRILSGLEKVSEPNEDVNRLKEELYKG